MSLMVEVSLSKEVVERIRAAGGLPAFPDRVDAPAQLVPVVIANVPDVPVPIVTAGHGTLRIKVSTGTAMALVDTNYDSGDITVPANELWCIIAAAASIDGGGGCTVVRTQLLLVNGSTEIVLAQTDKIDAPLVCVIQGPLQPNWVLRSRARISARVGDPTLYTRCAYYDGVQA